MWQRFQEYTSFKWTHAFARWLHQNNSNLNFILNTNNNQKTSII